MHPPERPLPAIEGDVALRHLDLQAVSKKLLPAKRPGKVPPVVLTGLHVDDESASQGEFGEDHSITRTSGMGRMNFPPRLPVLLLLFEDLFREVPRKEEDVIGHVREQFFRRVHPQVHPRCVEVLLMRALVHRVFDEVRSDAAVVEQGVPLGGGAVAGNPFPGGLHFPKNPEQVRPDLLRPVGEGDVRLPFREPLLFLLPQVPCDAVLTGRAPFRHE